MEPAISVVVPTYGRPDRLAALVAALEKQDVDEAFEVVIVDDGSPSPTWDELTRLAASSSLGERLQLLRQPVNQGPAAARNRGWQEASAPLVAFTDDDCEPQPGWLTGLLAALADHDVVQGETVPDPAGVWGPFSRTIVSTQEDFYPTCNMGYRRSVLAEHDGFDLTYRNAIDDTDLALRARKAGARTTFSSDALVHHAVHASDYWAYLREKPRWVTVPLVCRRHPEVRSLIHRPRVWRASHPPAIAAGAGLVLLASLPLGRSLAGRLLRLAAGAALLRPYYRFRTRAVPLPTAGPRRRILLLPAVLAADLFEVGVMVQGSIRYRCLVL